MLICFGSDVSKIMSLGIFRNLEIRSIWYWYLCLLLRCVILTILLFLIVVSTKEEILHFILYVFLFFSKAFSNKMFNKIWSKQSWEMDFEICFSASNHITPKEQVGAKWDAESVKMFTGQRVIKRSGGLSACSGLFLRFLHPFAESFKLEENAKNQDFFFFGLHLV